MASPTQSPTFEPPRNIAPRVLAALALVACVVAIFAIVSGSTSGSEDGPSATQERKSRTQQAKKQEETADTYTVVSGDTLSGIAEDVGISVNRLRKLNPDLETDTLNAGQVLQLRKG